MLEYLKQIILLEQLDTNCVMSFSFLVLFFFFFLALQEVVDHFYIALFSTLEQTHCTYIACDSEQMTSFHSAFFLSNIHHSGVLAALFGCYMAGAT